MSHILLVDGIIEFFHIFADFLSSCSFNCSEKLAEESKCNVDVSIFSIQLK